MRLEHIHYKILFAISQMEGVLTSAVEVASFISEQIVDTIDATRDLISTGLLCVYKGDILITLDGRKTVDDTMANVAMEQPSYYQWRNEALTGCDKKGKETKLENVAIPSGKRQSTSRQSFSHDAMMDLAKKMNMETAECARLVAEGLLRVCKRCKGVEIHGKNGKSVQSMCNRCRAKKAREERAKRSGKEQ